MTNKNSLKEYKTPSAKTIEVSLSSSILDDSNTTDIDNPVVIVPGIDPDEG